MPLPASVPTESPTAHLAEEAERWHDDDVAIDVPVGEWEGVRVMESVLHIIGANRASGMCATLSVSVRIYCMLRLWRRSCVYCV